MPGKHKIAWMVFGILFGVTSALAQSGAALEFSGDDYVEIGDSIDIRDALTVEFWIRYDAPGSNRIVSNRGGGYEMDIWADQLRFTVNSGVTCQADISAHMGQWVHIACTRDGAGGTHRIYVNGSVAVTTSQAPIIEAPASSLFIGANPADWGHFLGAIDEVRIFSAELDQETIAVWSTRKLGPGHPFIADLAGAWDFDEGAGQTVADYLGVNAGTLGGGSGDDAADPAWIGSGVVGNEGMTMGELKTLFR